MSNKLAFLTKMSLSKKIKTKWFLLANLLFMILIIGIINLDTIIKVFGGDFNQPKEIFIIDQVGIYDKFIDNLKVYQKYMTNSSQITFHKYSKTFKEGQQLLTKKHQILLFIEKDNHDYLKAKIVSQNGLDPLLMTFIKDTLKTFRSELVLKEYHLTKDTLHQINSEVLIKEIKRSSSNLENDMLASSIMQIITLPVFLLVMFLIQMIGAEINEEKSTKSMEIIISSVSPQIHLASKILAANLFVFIQGFLLLIFSLIALGIKYLINPNNFLTSYVKEVNQVTNILSISSSKIFTHMIPIILIMLVLTFLAYSLLAGILASMTTNMEDYQQLQTPIIVISLLGFYLSLMASLFKGSLFIQIMSYLPFISLFLAPALYLIGQITIYDLLLSIIFLILVIYLLIKYGIRIYKVGILNYSQTHLWKKIFTSIKEE